MSARRLITRRRLIALSTTLPASGAAATVACSGPAVRNDAAPTAAAGPVTLRAVLTSGVASLLKDEVPVVPSFEAANPNVKVEIELSSAGWDQEHRDKFLAKLAAGEAMDAWFVPTDWAPSYGKRSALLDLHPLLAKQRGVNVKDYWQPPLAAASYQGKLYALPYSVMTNVMWFNLDLLAPAGLKVPPPTWTWTDFLAMAQTMARTTGDGGGNAIWGHVGSLTSLRTMGFPFIWANGGRLFDDDSMPRALALDPAAAEALQWYADLTVRHHVAPTTAEMQAVGFPNGGALFNAGRAALSAGSAGFRGLKQSVKGLFRYDCQVLPAGKAGRAAATWADCLSLPATTRQPDTAARFLAHATGPAGARLLAPLGANLPSIESIARSKEWVEADGLNRPAALDTIARARPVPPSPTWPDVMTQALEPLWADLHTGKKTAADGLREIKPKVDDLLRTAG